MEKLEQLQENIELQLEASQRLSEGEWTPTDMQHPPIGQVCRTIYEHYDAEDTLQLTTTNLAIGVDDTCVKAVKEKFKSQHPRHRVSLWQPVDLRDKATMLEVAEFLTEMAKEE